jgi:hypothetical protein
MKSALGSQAQGREIVQHMMLFLTAKTRIWLALMLIFGMFAIKKQLVSLATLQSLTTN